MSVSSGDVARLEELGREECLRLLASEAVGRVAVALPHDAPLVVPVNYALDGDTVLFRSGFGTKLRAMNARRVSFEVDGFDEQLRVGWSVLARGRAEEIRFRDAGPLLPEPWVPDAKPYLVRIKIRDISGRRITRDPV